MAARTLLIAALIAGTAPTAFAQLSAADRTFVTNAVQAINYEIEASLLVDQYSSNAMYRDYAVKIANQQTEESGELESIVASADSSVRWPSGISPTEQRQLNALKNARNVDAMYRGQMIATVGATWRMYQNYIDRPEAYPQLKKIAEETILTFQQQLEDAKLLPPQ